MHTVYFKSISNELAIDKDVWLKMLKSDERINKILLPRPFKSKPLHDFLERNRLFFLIELLGFIWIWLPFPIIISYSFVRTFIKKITLVVSRKGSPPLNGSIAIVSGLYANKLFAEAEFRSYLKIQVASAVPLTSTEDNPLRSILDFSSFGIIVRAFYYSFIVVIKNYKKLSCSLKFQTFVTYEWVLLYLVFKKNHSNIERIAFTNHYDRWAVLFDSFALKKTVLFQHGLVLPNSKISLPHKLRNIEIVYCYNASSIEFFRNKAIDNALTEYRIKTPELQLTDLGVEGKKLLLIGTPYDPKIELGIVKDILEKVEGITIYIKPHPSFDQTVYNAFAKSDHVILIRDRNLYPKVDITLSFLSTLALQYEAAGIPNLSIGESDINRILTALNSIK